ncbi:MAG: ATP-binding protein, partial [Microcystaceae cyanobacterium]
EIEASVPNTIIFDEIRLRQILFNIVGNAIKFTEKGKVSISLKSQNIDSQTIRLILQVEDTGIGIPPEDQELIFDIFTQREGQSTRQYGGTGLGLTITRRLTEMLGGKIELESSLGLGSIFTFTFQPILVQSQSVSAPILNENHDLNQFAPAKILVVDDVASNRYLIRSFFELTHHHLLEAKDGYEAIKIAKTHCLDLIIMDILMPNLDGQEATLSLRQDPQTANIPIVILTASILATNRSLLEQYCQAFITKPIVKSDLVKALAGILPVSSERNQVSAVIPENSTITPTEWQEDGTNLEKLIVKLKGEEVNIWPKLQQTMIMRDLRKFSKQLQEWGQEYQSKILLDYVKKLDLYIMKFDGENLLKTIQAFPEVRKTLEDQLQKD